jgi:hypothetical protein
MNSSDLFKFGDRKRDSVQGKGYLRMGRGEKGYDIPTGGADD